MNAGPPGRDVLESLLAEALAAVEAGAAVRRAWASEPFEAGGTPPSLLAAGKAAVPMARAFVAALAGPLRRGLVVTKDGHGGDVPGCELRETAHPVPDARCEAAGRAALDLAATALPGETLVVLLSGGASALLACPAPGLGLDDLAATTDLLLASGADIAETNAVRRHLSALAGGRLADAFAGRAIRLWAVSDVPGDRLEVIGSGPCSADPSTFAEACAVLESRGLLGRVPEAVRAHLEAGRRGDLAETPKPGHPALARVEARVVARNADALAAAADAARRRGLRAEIDPEPLAGEAREAAHGLLARARAAAGGEPLVWIAGGETTVRFERAGRGGRSQELALAAAIEVAGDPGVALLAAGTDGSDGPTDAAGAYADGGSVARAQSLGHDARDALARHDSYTWWDAEGGLLRTGPTGTNVMDVAFVALAGASRAV